LISDIQGIQNFFKNDAFAANMGIVIESADEDSSLCRVDITPEMLNAGGTVQGGATFTLADFAFAVSSNSTGWLVVSQSNNITYISPPKGKVLYAHAKKISMGRKTCLYEVLVYDDAGTDVAHMTVNGFITGKKLDFE